MTQGVTPVEVQRASEQLRQEAETFDQRKTHENLWFILRLVMGFASIILLTAVMIVATYILMYNYKFPGNVINYAGVALFTDIVGLLIGVWKIVLNPASITRLAPVTNSQVVKS